MDTQMKKIKKTYYLLIGGLGLFSALMIFAAWYASSIAPNLMTRNYSSIQYTREMENAFIAIYLDETAGKPLDGQKAELFDNNLKKAKANITEDGENEVLNEITIQWENFKKKTSTPSVKDFKDMSEALLNLTKVNERGMYVLNERARAHGLTLVLSGVLSLALILIYAVLIADNQFERISKI